MYNFDNLLNRFGTNCVKWDMLEKKFGTTDMIPMGIADMDFECLPEIMEVLVERAKHPTYGYTVATDGYYNAIINWNKTRNDFEFTKEQIIPIPGCVAATTFALQALTNVGDKVMLHTPIYHPFYASIKDSGRETVMCEMKQDENLIYRIDWEDMEAKLKDPKLTLLILCSPHNPCGRVWEREELEKIVDLCDKHHVKIFSDEIHSDIIMPGHKHIPLLALNEKARKIGVLAAAPSKTFNIAGIKSSFYVIQDEELFNKVNNFYKTYHIGLDLFGYAATEAAYTKGAQWVDEMCAYIKGNAETVVDYCTKNTKIKAFVPQATFLKFLDFSAYGLTHEEVAEKCIKAGVDMNSGVMFGKEGGNCHMRMNIGTPRHMVQKALERLHAEFDK